MFLLCSFILSKLTIIIIRRGTEISHNNNYRDNRESGCTNRQYFELINAVCEVDGSWFEETVNASTVV